MSVYCVSVIYGVSREQRERHSEKLECRGWVGGGDGSVVLVRSVRVLEF